ncbi:MAG: peptidase, partial [Rivularia sp. (in: Bacteria)]|nr:peptidase [Rivularia sp. MS3]
MVKKSNRKHQNNFKLNFLISISSSLLITGYCSPANAVLNSTSTVQYRIAKTPDERIPEAVQDGIENIPAIPTPTQTPSPAPTQTPTPTPTQTPTPTPTQTPTQQTK